MTVGIIPLFLGRGGFARAGTNSVWVLANEADMYFNNGSDNDEGKTPIQDALLTPGGQATQAFAATRSFAPHTIVSH